MTITLTELIAQRQTLTLYGVRIADVVPRGHLGLALDPEGPVGFAAVRAVVSGQRSVELPMPRVISVYGDGLPAAEDDPLARQGERVWTADRNDLAVRLDFCKGALQDLLHGAV